MRHVAFSCTLAVLAACTARTPGAPEALALPGGVVVAEGSTGARLAPAELVQRLRAAELVLLGEVHDNPVHHAVRGQLIAAVADRKPAIVFEQFAESAGPVSPPATGEAREAWLDRSGFDRQGWRWPLHAAVVDAALLHGRGIWGSGISREALRGVVRDGAAAVPAHLRALLEQAPLDRTAQAAIDRELVEGHCGQLPEAMIPGMRAAQTARDAAMALALTRAARHGPAWLIAGNGHVRKDIAVPRLLRAIAPSQTPLVVGFLERTASGAEPDRASQALYDIVVITPRIDRPDPCAGLPQREQREGVLH